MNAAWTSIAIALLTLWGCTSVQKRESPQIDARFLTNFARTHELIPATPDSIRYIVRRIALEGGTSKVNMLCWRQEPYGYTQVDFLFSPDGSFKCISRVENPHLMRNAQKIALQFFNLQILAFDKDYAGNTMYTIHDHEEPLLMEIIDLPAYEKSSVPATEVLLLFDNYFMRTKTGT